MDEEILIPTDADVAAGFRPDEEPDETEDDELETGGEG